VEHIVAEHATTFWQRGARRFDEWPHTDLRDGCVRWLIDHELVLELRVPTSGPAELVVHDFSVLEPLQRALRTGHVRIRHATARDLAVASQSRRTDP
jgi:hypothetical protein